MPHKWQNNQQVWAFKILLAPNLKEPVIELPPTHGILLANITGKHGTVPRMFVPYTQGSRIDIQKARNIDDLSIHASREDAIKKYNKYIHQAILEINNRICVLQAQVCGLQERLLDKEGRPCGKRSTFR